MTRTAIDDDCGIAQALNVVGEWRTLLVLRNLFNGMRTFDAMQAHLGISTSVLAARLKTLTEAGVIEKHPSPHDGRSHEYRLTEKGLDLYPVLVSLLHWGEKWSPGAGGPRMTLVERATGAPVRPMSVTAQDGRPLDPREVTPVPGPGAGAYTRALVARWTRDKQAK
ncbi:winged helix-turn-helix transcriptional regulator [Mameliella sediminis]|uniref:winged helix-turn-helix transcriptional regulator n=1 Tax=Mameliella sediminis TaxID=2836866 RepID=UPI001C48A658|nr:helix-turn-helix domain-containing protein [Mameliella sediminis]MBV7395758.1 helix-turn-helix transcriptional regulator [Mameliella sediminis]